MILYGSVFRLRSWQAAAVLLGLCSAAVPATDLPEGDFDFRWENRRCWLQANQARLNEILEEVSEATGVEVQTDAGDESAITIVLEDKDLEALFKAIVRGSTITYRRDPESGEYLVQSVVTVPSADRAAKQQQLRQQVIAREKLDQKLAARPARPMRYSGIGARIQWAEDKQGVWIQPLSDEAPAAKAAIRTGDLIVAVNGRPIGEFKNIAEVTSTLRGPAKSRVNLMVRKPDGSEIQVPVVREVYNYRPDPGRHRIQ